MKRRRFLRVLGGAFALPLTGHAQEPTAPLVGFLSSRAPEESAGHVAACLDGLKAFGYVDGHTATVVYRWAEGDYSALPRLAAELMELHPAVIIAGGALPSAQAAKLATNSIPIVFVVGDAVGAGLVGSLSHPDTNVTGVSLMSGELGGKRLELLAALLPDVKVFALLLNPRGEDARSQIADVQGAIRALGRQLIIVQASTEAELDKSFATSSESGAKGLVVQNDPFFDSRRDQLIHLAAQNRLPAIYHIREFPAEGGLMSYGPSLGDAYRQAGIMAGRILRGAGVADLPVFQPTRFELVINMKAAEALGLIVPPTLLAQADEVIE